MPPEINSTIQYGVRYPDGTEDWNTTSWFGSVQSASSRRNFQQQYDLRLRQLGMAPAPVEFLTRTVTITISDTEVIVDDALEQDPANP